MYRMVRSQAVHNDDQKEANCKAKAKEMGNKLTKNFCGIYCKLIPNIQNFIENLRLVLHYLIKVNCLKEAQLKTDS